MRISSVPGSRIAYSKPISGLSHCQGLTLIGAVLFPDRQQIDRNGSFRPVLSLFDMFGGKIVAYERGCGEAD
jgi:hypothetical protein